MKSNYKPIGKYIQRVEHRNRDLKVTRLLGLSMTKEFRETIANIVGTDMSVYRVIEKNQFACDFLSTIRNGEKITCCFKIR
jgi:type I restriction enzyme S subunit